MTTWHVLDARSIWIKEFSAALAQSAPVCAWTPRITWTGLFSGKETAEMLNDPQLAMRTFPLQRGYARFPLSAAVRLGTTLTRRIERQTEERANSPLICTTPYYAPVAERWKGPVVYYQTDLTVGYDGVNPAQVRALDERLCRRAELVCPNSDRIAGYFSERGCPPEKLTVVPNATRESNVLPKLDRTAGPLPPDSQDLPRPIAGVIGNLAANMDWIYLLALVERTPEFSWLFVGPTSMPVGQQDQSAARDTLLARGGRIRFLGSRPYAALQSYARAFDVAILPYRKHEPTYSGSSTRFYEHLAACRPMLATRGFAELLRKEPLLHLADTPEESAHYLVRLRENNFADGHEQARWEASRQGTWESRADALMAALYERWSPPQQAVLPQLRPLTRQFAGIR